MKETELKSDSAIARMKFSYKQFRADSICFSRKIYAIL